MNGNFRPIILWMFCLLLLMSCSGELPKVPVSSEPQKEPFQPPAFELVTREALPRFQDDLDIPSLCSAIEKSLIFYDRVPADRSYPLGDKQVTVGTLKDSLRFFLELARNNRLDRDTLADSFDVYRAIPKGGSNPGLVTGYFEPVLEGRLTKDKEFSHPLYGLPPDLVTIDLSLFDSAKYGGQQVVGRVEKNRVVPYYTRAEIDNRKRIEKHGCELVWLRDPLDSFFLHVQGSGMILLPGGKNARIGYAGANGRPYRSIGNYLIQKELMKREDVSLQSLRAYLKDHPELQEEVLSFNESYVFFRWVQEGPLGSLNVPLTPGRSIATDTQFHPRGAIGFLETQKPVLDAHGEVIGWEPLHRWIVNQDTGGAIKGIGRVDLFCGTGENAEWMAGRMKHPGSLYFLIKREKKH